MKRTVSVKTRILHRMHWFTMYYNKYYYPYSIADGFRKETIWVTVELEANTWQERPRKVYEEVKRMVLNKEIDPIGVGDLVITPHNGIDHPDITVVPVSTALDSNAQPILLSYPSASVGDFIRSRDLYIHYDFIPEDTTDVRIEDISIHLKEENDGKRVSMPL